VQSLKTIVVGTKATDSFSPGILEEFLREIFNRI